MHFTSADDRCPDRSWTPGCLILLLLAGCEGTRTSEATVDEAPRLTLHEELRIGSAHDPDSGFTRIGPIAVDADGTAYVAETGESEIRVYDERGRRVRTIGRKGEGPGEFRSISGLGLLGDTLWVGDASNRRVTLFDREGNVLATFRAPEHPFEPQPQWVIRIMGTTYLGGGRLRGDRLAIMVQQRMPDTTISVPRFVFDTNGAIVDTLGVRRMSMSAVSSTVTVAGRELFVPRIRDDTLHVDADGESVLVARAVATDEREGTFSVVRWNADDTIFARRYRYRPEPAEPWVLDSIASRFARAHRASANLEPARLEQAVYDHVTLPRFLPPVFTARGSEDGGAWLRRDSDYHTTHRWLLLDADGAPRGHLELPSNATIRWSSGDRFWAVVPDELDVPWLVRYRIAAP